MLKKVIVSVLSIVMIMTLVPACFAQGTGVVFDSENCIKVKTFDELKSALESSGTVNIKLVRNIRADNRKEAEKGTSLPVTEIKVSGNKLLDLNGRKIRYTSYKTASEAFSDYGTETYFIDVPEGSSLTVTDSGKKGGITYDGQLQRGKYNSLVIRNVFSVEGELSITGGCFTAGSEKKYKTKVCVWDGNGYGTEKKAGLYSAVFGSCVSVFGKGSFFCGGGYFYARGFSGGLSEAAVYSGADTRVLIEDGDFNASLGADVFQYSPGADFCLKLCTYSLDSDKLLRTADVYKDGKIYKTAEDVSPCGKSNINSEILLLADAVNCTDTSVSPKSGLRDFVSSDGGKTIFADSGSDAFCPDGLDVLFPDNAVYQYVFQAYDGNGSWNMLTDWTGFEPASGGTYYLKNFYPELKEKTRYRIAFRTIEKHDDYNASVSILKQSNYLTVLYGFDLILTKEECSHEWELISDTASCIGDGIKYYCCSLCGEIKTETSLKNDKHVFSAVHAKNAYVCGRECIFCGASDSDNYHYFVETGRVSDGYNTFIYKSCVYCGDTREEFELGDIVPTNEGRCSHGNELTDEELTDEEHFARIYGTGAGCQSPGRKSRIVCRDCGATFDFSGKALSSEDTYIPASGHAFFDSSDNTCVYCGYTREIGHWYGEYSSNSNYHYKKCQGCGALGCAGAHRFNMTVVSEPTCENEGLVRLECSTCGFSMEISPEKLGHQLMYVSDIPASCIDPEQSDYYKCLRCGKIYADAEGYFEISAESTVESPPLPDVHIGGQLACDKKYHWENCSCGEIINKEKHSFKDGICTVCGYKR